MLEPRDEIEYAYETANIRFALFRPIILAQFFPKNINPYTGRLTVKLRLKEI